MAALAAFLTGCGAVGPERPCTAAGALVGVTLDVEPPTAEKVTKATVKVCWDGTCETPKLTLHPSTSAAPATCSGTAPDDVCGARAVRTGGKHGFATIPDLPHKAVQVTVTLYGSSDKRLLRDQITLTPKLTYPNGKQCDKEGAPQAQLVVDDGKLRAR